MVNRYENCIITNSHPDICQVSHIIQYSECEYDEKYSVNNGLLLRNNLHKMFDNFDFSINPKSFKPEFSDKVITTKGYEDYRKYNDMKINLNKSILKYLESHYEKFK